LKALRVSGLLAAAGCAIALGVFVAQADGGPSHRPPPLYVGSQGLYVKATQGSYCYSGKGKGVCADYAYPLSVKAHLPVAPGRRISVDGGRTLRRAGATLLRVKGQDLEYLKVLRLKRRGKGRHWRGRLPSELGGANVLSVDVSFRHRGGSSNAWAGIDPSSG
jgi:hypothetical protein